MNPAGHVREVLGWCREAGWTFSDAWTKALQSMPRGDPTERADWVEQLQWSRPAFQAHYEGTDYDAAAMIAVGELTTADLGDEQVPTAA